MLRLLDAADFGPLYAEETVAVLCRRFVRRVGAVLAVASVGLVASAALWLSFTGVSPVFRLVRGKVPSELDLAVLVATAVLASYVALRNWQRSRKDIADADVSAAYLRSCEFIIDRNDIDDEFAMRLQDRFARERLVCRIASTRISDWPRAVAELNKESKKRATTIRLVALSPESMSSERARADLREALKGAISGEEIVVLYDDRFASWVDENKRDLADLAEDVRKIRIRDFSKWRDYNFFEHAFEQLIYDVDRHVAAPHFPKMRGQMSMRRRAPHQEPSNSTDE